MGALFGVITVGIVYYFSADLAITVIAAIVVAILLFALHDKRFNGPPIGEEIKRRQAAIAAAEKAMSAAS
jgi:ABC-type bacteriocin/lantibiotic exporter with double-glycine peptidase domain